jgi:hypothetical protein
MPGNDGLGRTARDLHAEEAAGRMDRAVFLTGIGSRVLPFTEKHIASNSFSNETLSLSMCFLFIGKEGGFSVVSYSLLNYFFLSNLAFLYVTAILILVRNQLVDQFGLEMRLPNRTRFNAQRIAAFRWKFCASIR